MLTKNAFWVIIGQMVAVNCRKWEVKTAWFLIEFYDFSMEDGSIQVNLWITEKGIESVSLSELKVKGKPKAEM